MRFDPLPKGHKVTKRHFMAKIVLPLLSLINRFALP